MPGRGDALRIAHGYRYPNKRLPACQAFSWERRSDRWQTLHKATWRPKGHDMGSERALAPDLYPPDFRWPPVDNHPRPHVGVMSIETSR